MPCVRPTMTPLQTIALFTGAIQLPLALTVWSLLHRRWARLPVTLWAAGSIAQGLGITAFAARGMVPGWLSHQVAYTLLVAAVLLRTVALRVDLDLPTRPAQVGLAGGLGVGFYLLCVALFGPDKSTLASHALAIAYLSVFAWHAAMLGQRLQSRSGSLLASVEAVFILALTVRLLAMGTGWTVASGIGVSWDFALILLTGLATVLCSSLGYLGLVLDGVKAATRRASAARLAEAQRRDTADATATTLRDMLQQRNQLADERARLLQLLTHDIRQPLHHASAALQAAVSALQAGHGAGQPPAPAEPTASTQADQTNQDVQARLQRAQAVLQTVRAALDSSLTAGGTVAQAVLTNAPSAKQSAAPSAAPSATPSATSPGPTNR